jgi:catechol 2,3-dioxygenase-like lactoylglutathione lyase family enzyme
VINVIGFDHVNLRVADLDRALRFYQGALGLREKRRNTRQDGSVSLLALRAGNCIVFLQPSPGYAPPAAPRQSGLDHYSLEIECQDPEQLAGWLREQGVEIVDGPVRRDGAHGAGTSIYVRDPDGHRLEIKQYNRG